MFVRLIVSEVIVNTNYNSFGYKIVVNAMFSRIRILVVAFWGWQIESNCWSYFFITVKVKVKAFIVVKP